MLKTQIDPSVFPEMLDSAANAGAKGQSQFFTPVEFGRMLSVPLPRIRPTIVDLNCGAGNLLEAAANQTTTRKLGCDIHLSGKESRDRIQRDLRLLYPLLTEVEWEADLFVLNPPWDLHWYREGLRDLETSADSKISEAFLRHDGRLSKDCIK